MMDEFTNRRRQPAFPSKESADFPPGVIPRDVLDLGDWAFRTVWFHPRDTIRQIVEVNPEYRVNLLIALAGIAESLERASGKNTSEDLSWGFILVWAIVLGPGFALIGAWISAHLIRITGNWMGARGVYTEIKAAIGWSGLPTAVGLALWVPLLALIAGLSFLAQG